MMTTHGSFDESFVQLPSSINTGTQMKKDQNYNLIVSNAGSYKALGRDFTANGVTEVGQSLVTAYGLDCIGHVFSVYHGKTPTGRTMIHAQHIYDHDKILGRLYSPIDRDIKIIQDIDAARVSGKSITDKLCASRKDVGRRVKFAKLGPTTSEIRNLVIEAAKTGRTVYEVSRDETN